MNGFRTARALVLDDEPEQAMAVVQALGALGIASLYHDADPSRDYRTKHSGLRLLFLDMVLANRSPDSNSEVSIVDTLVAALSQILDPSAGYVVIVCWTRHGSIADLLKERFREEFADIHVVETIVVEKEEFIELPSGKLRDAERFSQLLRQVEGAMKKAEPVALLSSWEQLVHRAATQTTGTIYDAAAKFVNGGSGDWAAGAYSVCAALAVAERGTRIEKEDAFAAVMGLADALGPLLLDRIENFSEQDIQVPPEASTRLREAVVLELGASKKGSALTNDLRGLLNTLFNLSRHAKEGVACPGNLYVMENANLDAVRPFYGDEFWSELKEDTAIDGKAAPPEGSYLVLVEVTPACDFAQAKARVPRFTAGFLVPLPLLKQKPPAFVREVCFFSLGKEYGVNAGDYQLIINAHFLCTLPPSVAEALKPAMRLRSGVLADVIAFLSQQISRPGFLQVAHGKVLKTVAAAEAVAKL